MAFSARKINPIDTKPGTAVGISIPFNSPSVFFLNYTTKDAIKNNLLNFFLTNKNERYLNNSFGANLKGYLFEQITTNNLTFLKEDIQNLINRNFTNINVESLNINEFPDTNEIFVELKYSIINTGIVDNIQITFS